jgi:hypothetical protein
LSVLHFCLFDWYGVVHWLVLLQLNSLVQFTAALLLSHIQVAWLYDCHTGSVLLEIFIISVIFTAATATY